MWHGVMRKALGWKSEPNFYFGTKYLCDLEHVIQTLDSVLSIKKNEAVELDNLLNFFSIYDVL